ncbi:Cytochrome c biogenesis protein CcmG [Phocoenobacter uteri]|uniref:Cytochrome c biogenesis protein CcmG n=1 Tax=Phocoenobacter uteri TaxID=146806 RepID=A0A379C7T1_9PAST|nr:DsbE family thiol:disulfide interchange protein [Phocoenobacter uteri]MDG6882180.1 hypothetical protein [Phocoenobacter uteri]SUB58334.1 Cytochrome c biogenesis protein CcmG [Phocoenobacter uteri]
MKRALIFLPLLLLVLFIGVLLSAINNNKNPATINQPLPQFNQVALMDESKQFGNQDMPTTFYLINVWASWCNYCKQELPTLKKIAQTGVPIVGLNYRDNREQAVRILQKFANPFIFNLYDKDGTFANKLGVNATPQTYLIDNKGIIKLRYSGELTMDVWQQDFLPLIKQHKANQ